MSDLSLGGSEWIGGKDEWRLAHGDATANVMWNKRDGGTDLDKKLIKY